MSWPSSAPRRASGSPRADLGGRSPSRRSSGRGSPARPAVIAACWPKFLLRRIARTRGSRAASSSSICHAPSVLASSTNTSSNASTIGARAQRTGARGAPRGTPRSRRRRRRHSAGLSARLRARPMLWASALATPVQPLLGRPVVLVEARHDSGVPAQELLRSIPEREDALVAERTHVVDLLLDVRAGELLVDREAVTPRDVLAGSVQAGSSRTRSSSRPGTRPGRPVESRNPAAAAGSVWCVAGTTIVAPLSRAELVDREEGVHGHEIAVENPREVAVKAQLEDVRALTGIEGREDETVLQMENRRLGHGGVDDGEYRLELQEANEVRVVCAASGEGRPARPLVLGAPPRPPS